MYRYCRLRALRSVAVKMISKLNFSSDKDTANMKLETELMMRVRGHPNVVRATRAGPCVCVRRRRGCVFSCSMCRRQVELKECFEDRGHYYLVMELCIGGELMDRIVAHQSFSEKVGVPAACPHGVSDKPHVAAAVVCAGGCVILPADAPGPAALPQQPRRAQVWRSLRAVLVPRLSSCQSCPRAKGVTSCRVAVCVSLGAGT